MSHPPVEFDVIIAGGGLTGSTLALALARSGLSVALIDADPPAQKTTADRDGRASAIAPAAMKQWRVLGLDAGLAPYAEPILAIAVTDGRAPGASGASGVSGFLQFDHSDLEDGGPLGFMIENQRIRLVLAEALGGAHVERFGARLQGVTQEGRTACAVLADGRRLRAPLVVGAEGRSSVVRDAAALKTFGWRYPQFGVVATVALSKPHQGVAHELFLPQGPLAILPLTDQRASLVWSETRGAASALISAAPDVFEAHLARRFGERLGAPRLLGQRFQFPLSLQISEDLIATRTALVGEAAHAVHPIAGQGLNMGLKDVAALAEIVVDARRLGEDWGSALVLQRYAQWRRFDAAALAVATDLFTRMFSTDNRWVRLVRGVGLDVVDRARPLRRLFVREAAGALGDLPRLLRGEAL